MQRRSFLKTAAVLPLAAGAGHGFDFFEKTGDPIIGHGDFRFKINLDWGKQDPTKIPVNDCHEMAFDRNGRIFLLNTDTKNNVLIYNKDGRVLETWGTDYPGAHGLTLADEGGTEMLYIADYERHEIVKTTLDGRVVKIFPYPADSGKYSKKEDFVPTETAIAANGDVYIADGYGQDWITHYDAEGRLKNIFGGRGDQPGNLRNAHGIALDYRNPSEPCLLVTSREENMLKRYTLDGRHLQTIHLPNAFICRPVVRGEHVFFAVLVSKMPWDSQSGFVLILDKNNRVVAAPGGSTPTYDASGLLQPLYQTVKVFKHPHDVLPDADGNLYVAQWNSGKVYPARLERV